MVQHSLIIENDSGKAVREDINDAFQAVVTNYAGLEEPAVTYPNMFWYDTQNHVLKIRNEVNTEWIIVTSVDQTDLTSTANVGPGRHRLRRSHWQNQTIPTTSVPMHFDTQDNEATSGTWGYNDGEIIPPDLGVYQVTTNASFTPMSGDLSAVTLRVVYFDGNQWQHQKDWGQIAQATALYQEVSMSVTSVVNVSSIQHKIAVWHHYLGTGDHQWLSARQQLTIVKIADVDETPQI